MSSYPFPAAAPPQQATTAADPTAVMGRRIAAWVVDFLLYVLIMSFVGPTPLSPLAEYYDTSDIPGIDCSVVQEADDVAGCLDIGDRVYFTDGDDVVIQLVVFVAFVLIYSFVQGATGRTPGKAALGVKVVDEQGANPGFGKSFLRTFMWIVDLAPWCVPLVGFITGLTTRGHRRVGDMAAKTLVVGKAHTGPPQVPGLVTAASGGYGGYTGGPGPYGAPGQGGQPGQPWGGTLQGPTGPPTTWGGQPQGQPAGGWGAPPSGGYAPPGAPGAGGPAAAGTPSGPGGPAAPGGPSGQQRPAPPGAWTPPTDAATAAGSAGSSSSSGPSSSGPSSASVPGPPSSSSPATESVSDRSPEAQASPPEGTPAPGVPSSRPSSSPGTPAAASPGPAPAAPTTAPTTGAPAQPAAAQPAAAQPAGASGYNPQWDAARGTYIVWEPNRGKWLGWDEASQEWKPL